MTPTPPPKSRKAKRAAYFSPQHQAAIARRNAAGGKPRQKTRDDLLHERRLDLPEASVARVKAMIIHEDAHVLAFHKPSGLSSQGGRGNEYNMDDLMWAFAKSNGKKPRLVHRLDRDTSGLLLAAKTFPDASFLGKAMIARKFHKTYLCIVANPHNLADKGVIDTPLRREDIGRESYSRPCAADHPEAQVSRTDYEVISRNSEAALVRAYPHTGRMHQLRVHFAHTGSSIMGDVRYGGALSCSAGRVIRLMLHAVALEFPHPCGKIMQLDCPLAEDMARMIEALDLQI